MNMQFFAEREIDLNQSYSCSDSISDLPMLKLVGYPRPVNPDRLLRRHGWPIVSASRRR